MKKCFLLLLCLFSFAIGFSQKLYFPKINYKDSITTAKNMPVLATKVIAAYAEKNRNTYLDNLYMLQFTAQRYKEMQATLNTLGQEISGDSLQNREMGFPFRVYANTALRHPQAKTEFEAAFTIEFGKIYNALSTKGQAIAETYYGRPITDVKSSYDLQLENARANDSITIQDAISLCRIYAAYTSATATSAIGKKILDTYEKEKYTIDENIIITLPNGSTIAGTMVRDKAITEPQPVVMMYNIYAGIDLKLCKRIVSKGYTGFVANTRGKRLSNDPIEPYEHDGDDVYSIIDWVSKQPWCNGKIGMYGGSYLGFSQWSAMKKVHPALKTIVPQVSVGAGIDFPMQNGVFMSYCLRWIHFIADNKLINSADFGDSKKWETIFTQYFKTGSAFRSLDQLEGNPSMLFQRWLDHPDYDAFWQNMTPQKDAFARINIPILSTTGYYDDDQLGAMYYYKQYQKWNKSDNYYLVIGPYDHGGAQIQPSLELGGYTIDEKADISINDLVFEWFDYILKEGKRPEILKDKVNFEVMGKNEWKHVASLDQMHNRSLTFYLAAEGPKNRLTPTAPKKAAAISQTIDFKDRSEANIYTDAHVCGFPLISSPDLKTEKQLLVFESKPIEKPFAISGSLTAALKVSTNKKDMDIVIQLYEKTPDGHYFALANNLQRASYAKDRSKRQLLKPNTIETIRIDQTFITSKQLQKGSQIVVVLGVNKNPNWQINYGTGKDVSDETIADAAVPMEIKWYTNSTITLPILE
ncbi:CocE/NonD family hydrolase [Flavobacterium humi]|uniref:CocE/NonD family hydrolase n=1 Tax=Flavobacterium humi TaxID=2562683 RepID=A0A4Z0L2C5_9FLAO|nr:CocE/NonD family hydrolase [Flavobacterium humi]TGD56572.1 CocE/NonD family hydrolase [Flavobacterium humi]